METTRTQVSIAADLPRKNDLKSAFIQFGLLNLLVVGMVAVAFIGKATVSEVHPFSTSTSGATMTTNSYTNPGFYGRTTR